MRPNNSFIQVQAGQGAAPGQNLYKGPIDCGRQLLRTGGISSLYRGFGATFIRGELLFALQIFAQVDTN